MEGVLVGGYTKEKRVLVGTTLTTNGCFFFCFFFFCGSCCLLAGEEEDRGESVDGGFDVRKDESSLIWRVLVLRCVVGKKKRKEILCITVTCCSCKVGVGVGVQDNRYACSNQEAVTSPALSLPFVFRSLQDLTSLGVSAWGLFG